MKKNSLIILSFIALCGVGAAVYFGTKSENSKPENSLNTSGKQGESGEYRITKIFDVGDVLTPECFYAEKHRMIYQTMVDLSFKGDPIDLISISNKLKENKQMLKLMHFQFFQF